MIGDTLREAREKQNLSIKDIESGTSIRALYLESIEKGEYDKLPGEVYTKGFIRNYANFLHLDADKLVHQYMEENNPEGLKAKQEEKEQELREEDARKGFSYAKEHPEAARAAEEPPKKRPVRLQEDKSSYSDFHERVKASNHRQNVLLAAVVLIVVLAGAYFMLSDDDSSADTKPSKQVTTQAKKDTGETAKPADEQKQYDDVEVTAKFTNRCWISVKADGKSIYEGTVEKGKTMQWKADDSVEIRAGNAGAVSFTVNGQDMGKAGEEGQVADKTFTKDSKASDTSDRASKSSKNK
ncbi:MAG: DUF4115 domain-containing protein [Selenomonadaceae bacterium]|nr:DUF4115 domain-containing protein [Selenomonadaceae bacterium]MDY2685832.1 DUF4115 domain-containing protein [Selenomonadaceae bacterium]